MPDNDLFKYNAGGRIKNGDLTGKYKTDWVEENISFFEVDGKTNKVPETGNYLGASITAKRLSALLFIIWLAVAVIFGRIFYLQIIKGDYYRTLAENNRARIKPIPSERGLIYDRNGELLVQNIPSFSLSIVPQDLPKDAQTRGNIIRQISDISGVPVADIEALVNKYKNYSYESLPVKDNLDYESALKLYIENANLPGIIIEKGTKRLYRPAGVDLTTAVSSLSHLVGYLGKINDTELPELKPAGYLPSDYLGKVGLEKYYESELRGVYGKKKIEVDALGREQNVLAEEAPQPGKNLILSVDLAAQEKMESLIQAALKRNKKTRAAGIAMDPQTGEVLALVSLPGFNNNDFSSGITEANYNNYLANADRPLFNRAIAGTYPSGSIVKPLIAAAALQEGIITKNTSVLSTGGITIDKWNFVDWKAGGHGITNVAKAIAWSVNTFFYYIGGGYKSFVGLGADRIVEYLRRFNLSAVTNIDLPGESAGFLPSKQWKEETKKEMWYIGDTYNLSIGQGDLLVTPVQAAVWTSAVANGGTVIRPHVVSAVFDPLTKKAQPLKTQVLNSGIVSAANMAVVKQGMRDCVTYGSCQLMKTLNFTSGAKTGTAQWSSTKPEHAWFTAFAPYNEPKIVVVILVEEGGEGSTVSMPIARDFLAWWGQKYLK